MKFIDKIISDDFLFRAITENVHGKRRKSGTNFLNIDCPLCVTRGETADRKQRCGIKQSEKGLGIYCFNCGFRTLWQTGQLLSNPMKDFLRGIGLDDIEINRLNHKAFTYRSMFEASPEAMLMLPESFAPNFETKSLPKGAKSFEQWATEGCDDPDFIDVVTYLYSRGEEIANATTYYWTPSTFAGMNRRVIVPFLFQGRIVGYTARSVDPDTRPRYQMETQANYLFNSAVMSMTNRKYIILCEGVFDALSINGVGTLGAHLNPQQIAWIKSFGKTVILLPDRDARGGQMIDIAMQNNWHVAFPRGTGQNWWDDDIKDAADAVKRYGRLFTLLSIIETATDIKMKINVQRKLLINS